MRRPVDLGWAEEQHLRHFYVFGAYNNLSLCRGRGAPNFVLCMTELLIGRESKDNRLQLTIGAKVGVYGTVGSVPQSISRKHCIISFNDEKDSIYIHKIIIFTDR